ncbi:ABC transporter substrate-binding protein [Candidatus Gracilibacteria bacterium]|nr:ABC transporter substrate-binding protein [Candidatus Gracilibacteria bacterium]
MIYNKIIKLKKYLFLISILFFVLSLTHLIYLFLYSDSKLVPIKGGTISEGLIGGFPSLNPLEPLNGNNKYLVNLLYRSLLQYDPINKKIVSDLASCDIENLKQIECYLNDNIYWSNGEKITVDDVISTYKLLQNTGVNKIISSLLKDSTIEKNNNTIIFKNKKRDINFLNIFFQPILSKNTIDSIGNDVIFGNFPTREQIYSGDFVISNISSDSTLGVTKIFLNRNPFNNNGNISKLIIKLFPNTNSLLQNKETVNIFNDNKNIIGNSIPRLESHKYSLSQYVSLFINSNKIKDLELRNYILNKINRTNLINILGEENFKEIKNPYLTEKSINLDLKNKNFEKILAKLGYYKKSKIISNYLPSTNKYSDEVKVENKKEIKDINIPDSELKIDKFQTDSKYIIKPIFVDKYNFITKDNILLQGKVGTDVKEVYINDYKLSNYKAGNQKFYYRLKENYKNIKEGVNSYKIIFNENGKKVLKEEIFFIYSKDKNKLEKYKKDFIKNLFIKEQKEKEKLLEATVKVEIDKNKLEKLSSLDDNFYYNENLEKYSLNLYYVSTEKDLEKTAIYIKNTLTDIGINIELYPIRISNITNILQNKNEYDMILTGVNLGIFNYNIFPYFHSSQVKNGYNFSNYKKTSLDILLEDLKSEIKTKDEIKHIENKILEILKKEQIIKTLYTPKINLLIDKNIKNISVPKLLTSKTDRKLIYNNIYIKEEKIINFQNKGFINFIKFLIENING